MRILVKAFVLLFSVQALAAAAAPVPTGSRQVEIERVLVDYYRFMGEEDPAAGSALRDCDRIELTRAVADEISLLAPRQFNDLMGHLLADYRTNPEHRAVIEGLLGETRLRVLNEVLGLDRKHPIEGVIDDVFSVFTVAYAFRFGKGIWETRGSGLQGLPRFRLAVSNVVRNLAATRQQKLTLLGIGTGAAAAHAIYEYLETKRLDPASLLESVQKDVVREIAVRMAEARAQLKAVRLEQLRSRPAEFAASAEKLQDSAEQALGELEHLRKSAPQLAALLNPAADDAAANRNLCAQILMRLEQIELSGALRGSGGVRRY